MATVCLMPPNTILTMLLWYYERLLMIHSVQLRITFLADRLKTSQLASLAIDVDIAKDRGLIWNAKICQPSSFLLLTNIYYDDLSSVLILRIYTLSDFRIGKILINKADHGFSL